MTEDYRMRPATLEDWPGIAALDQEIFGAYGAQEEPAIIRSRLVTFPQGCAVLERGVRRRAPVHRRLSDDGEVG